MNPWKLLVFLGALIPAWPLPVHAQSSSEPVVGFLHPASAQRFAAHVAAFRQGLNEHGYYEGRKAATATIPILFVAGPNPVDVGLVSSISRPGGNATGVSMETTDMLAKRLEILRELVPAGAKVAMLRSLAFTVEKFEAEFADSNDLIGFTLDAGSKYEDRFEAVVRAGARGLIVSADPNFTAHHKQIVDLAAKYGLPAIYPWRLYVAAGGLASYGPSLVEAYRQIGRYAGRILKGAKPETMPVEAPNTFELVLNLKTAQALGLQIPDSLMAVADEKLQ